MRTRVGGDWRQASDVTDLGVIRSADAVDFLLLLARQGRPNAAEDAILPAILAKDVVVWPRLLSIARDDDVDIGVRKSSMFWLAQSEDPQVLDVFEEILLN